MTQDVLEINALYDVLAEAIPPDATLEEIVKALAHLMLNITLGNSTPLPEGQEYPVVMLSSYSIDSKFKVVLTREQPQEEIEPCQLN